MEIQIWIVNTCIPEEGEKPCIPSPFGTAAEAEAYADEMMRGEWESSGVEDDDGEPVEYPGDWREAQERLVEWNGPGWGTWEITTHRVTIKPDTMYPRRMFMDGCTSHVSPEARDWLEEQGRIAAAAQTGQDEEPAIHIGRLVTGWFFYANEEPLSPDLGIPDDVARLMQEARKRGCEYVLLDRDAQEIDGLPTYEW